MATGSAVQDPPGSRLGEYLTARRRSVSPERTGLPVAGRARRVPGLRREEVAALAGISVEYYTRLERGRDRSPSGPVLDALARALALDTQARRYLHSLVHSVAGQPPAVSGQLGAPMARALRGLGHEVAYVLDQHLDVVASTPTAQALLGRAVTANQLEYLFLDPRGRTTYPDWEAVAVEAVAALRSSSSEREDHPRLQVLLERLDTGSAAFRRLWARYDIHGSSSGSKRIRTEGLGEVEVHWDAFSAAYTSHQVLVLYSAEPGTPSARAVDRARRIAGAHPDPSGTGHHGDGAVGAPAAPGGSGGPA